MACRPCYPPQSCPSTGWSRYPATQNVDVDCRRIVDVSGIGFSDGTFINTGTPPPPTAWSQYPATQNVDVDCRRIVDVSGITFCDGTYIGPGNSFDISSSQVLVLSGATDPAGNYSGASVISRDRIYQQLNTDPSWNAVNGYYALAKDAAPVLSTATAEKAITTWSAATIVGNVSLYYNSVCYSPERKQFVTVGGLTTGVHDRVNTSSDGITWNPVTLDASFNLAWRSVIWCPQKNIYVAVGTGSGATLNFQKVMTSPDGITWTRYNSAENTTSWEGLVYSPELDLFVSVATNTDASGSGVGSVNRVMTSTNGQAWTLRAAAAAQTWNTVIWAKELGLFIACSSDGVKQIMTSPNGIDWTLRDTPGPTRGFRELAYSPQLGIAIAFDQNTGNIITSYDGITWILQPTPLSNKSYNAIAACWANSLNMFVTINSVGLSGVVPDVSAADIMWSKDGRNWKSSRIFNNVDTRFRHLIYSDELGIFVGVSSTVPVGSPRIIYSSLRACPPTSYNVFDSSSNQIDQRGNWTIQQVMKTATVAAAASISVSGVNLLYITGTGTITSLTGGAPNQELVLVFNNDNIQLNASTSIRLSANPFGGASSANDTISLLFTGTEWYELIRSTNA